MPQRQKIQRVIAEQPADADNPGDRWLPQCAPTLTPHDPCQRADAGADRKGECRQLKRRHASRGDGQRCEQRPHQDRRQTDQRCAHAIRMGLSSSCGHNAIAAEGPPRKCAELRGYAFSFSFSSFAFALSRVLRMVKRALPRPVPIVSTPQRLKSCMNGTSLRPCATPSLCISTTVSWPL